MFVHFAINALLYFFAPFSALIARLEAKLGPSSETLRVIRQEMERDYYSAKPMLVDPLLTRCELTRLYVHAHARRKNGDEDFLVSTTLGSPPTPLLICRV